MTKWKIPQPVPINWPMRQVSSAKITVRELDDGRQQRIIEHAPLPGVTPEMMVWFLKNIDHSDMGWQNHKLLAYRYWHPQDHIYFKILGTPGAGCRFHIVEAFQANPKYLNDIVFNVPKLDSTGLRLELRMRGYLVASIDEDFGEGPEGMRYRVTMTLGSTKPVLGRLTRFIRRHVIAEKLDGWYQHNVEEVGNLPHFLPELYAEHVK